MITQNFIKEFVGIEEVDQKYEYLIELGKIEPKLNPKSKTARNIVKNCQNKVWITLGWVFDSSKKEKLLISFESESRLVAGIVFLIKSQLEEKTKFELSEFLKDKITREWTESIFDPKIISITRQNGIKSIFAKIIEFIEK
jgi:cysteine desulfuration protein SufE